MAVSEIKNKPNHEVIDILKEMLERAESGNIQSIAIAGATGNAQTLNVFSCQTETIALIGELRVLERDIIDLCVDTRRKPAWEFCE